MRRRPVEICPFGRRRSTRRRKNTSDFDQIARKRDRKVRKLLEMRLPRAALAQVAAREQIFPSRIIAKASKSRHPCDKFATAGVKSGHTEDSVWKCSSE